MEEFNTIDKVKELFRAKGLGGDNDIYLALLKDFGKQSGMVAGMEYPYTGMLVDITDTGIGMYHLVQPKFSLRVLIENLVIDKDSYTFLSNDDIKSVEVKKFALLDSKRKLLIIKTNDKKTHYLYGSVADTLIPYNSENMQKLLAKYSSK